MLEWLVLGLLAMSGGGYLAYRMGKARGARAALRAAQSAGALRGKERTVRDVRADDILQWNGRDWLVEGTVQYDEDGHRWRGVRTVDAPDECWFVIGLDRVGPMTVRVLRAAKSLEVNGYPSESLEYEGTSYRLAQRGTATAMLNGNLGDLPGAKGVAPGSSTRCRWWRYGAAGEKQLIVEQWGETYRALAGEVVAADQVDMLSAS
jgi:hypothetical protein